MAEKVLAEVYFTYGKGDGEKLGEWFVIEDTPEGRRDLLGAVYYDDALESEDDFANGKTNVFPFDRHGGDWDEPTGGYITVGTRDDLISEIKDKAEKEINRINDLFNGK